MTAKSTAFEKVSDTSSMEWEVADIFRIHGSVYRAGRCLSWAQRKVMRAIETCRTAWQGGHEEQCTRCGHKRNAYNSCRDRHCPKCQAMVKAQWLENRKAELLPVPYFHAVFTLPHDLHPIVGSNKAKLLNMLFAAASRTLLEFGRNNLGGKMGFTMIPHTWNQLLHAHYHLHCVIPAGALSTDRRRWNHGNSKFLFPVKALSKVFRGKFLAALERAYTKGELSFVGPAAALSSPDHFASLLEKLRGIDWVVYCKRPFAGPQQVLEYLGRYTHRVAISNYRIVGLSKDEVSFKYRNRRQGNTVQIATLLATEFIRRFLLHVLPLGFVRIRHFGFLANRCKADDLGRCRELLGLSAELPRRRQLTAAERMNELLGIDIDRCPVCGHGRMVRAELLQLAYTNDSVSPRCQTALMDPP